MSKQIPLQRECDRHWLAAKYPEMVRTLGSQKNRLRWLVENFAAPPNQKRLPGTADFVVFTLLQSGASFNTARMPRLRTSDLNDLAQKVSAGLTQIVSGEQWKVEVKEPVDRILIRLPGLRGVDADEPYGARSTWAPRMGSAFPISFLLSVGDLIERQQRWLSNVDARTAIEYSSATTNGRTTAHPDARRHVAPVASDGVKVVLDVQVPKSS